MTISEFKQSALKQLANSPSPALDIEVLLEYYTGLTKTQILMNRDRQLNLEQEQNLVRAVTQRSSGLPVAYITGHKEFYGYDFTVSPAVLIPKPDTEILVEKAVEIIYQKLEMRPNSIPTVCDMCTGSGCIAISVFRQLADEFNVPLSRMPKFTLVDISSAALEVARKNAERLLSPEEQEYFRFVQSNLFEMIPYTFDVILTNPPYIPSSMVDELLKDGRNEPRLALDGDVKLTGDSSKTDDGLEIIRNIFLQVRKNLSPMGEILMETGEYNAEAAAKLAEKEEFKTEIFKDLEGQLRVVYCR